MKKKILYISTNDGSDTRIFKEIQTLSSKFNILYLGVGSYGETNFVKKYCSQFILIKGKRNSLPVILKQIFYFYKLLFSNKISSIHIVNEQLMIFFYPALFFKKTLLDVFDSIFLRCNKPGNQWLWLKRLVYLPVNHIIVTDENRKRLMPKYLHKKITIINNYPLYYEDNNLNKTINSGSICIFYFGSLNEGRGSRLISELIQNSEKICVMMAGWITDEYTSRLIENPKIQYLGTRTQTEIAQIAQKEADYILCVYSPNNENNINASPNKIFDAIQTKTPVIINKEIKVAEFVQKNKLGVVIDSFDPTDISSVIIKLEELKGTFRFDDNLKKKYAWESLEKKLIRLHEL